MLVSHNRMSVLLQGMQVELGVEGWGSVGAGSACASCDGCIGGSSSQKALPSGCKHQMRPDVGSSYHAPLVSVVVTDLPGLATLFGSSTSMIKMAASRLDLWTMNCYGDEEIDRTMMGDGYKHDGNADGPIFE